MSDQPADNPIIIPIDSLKADTLRAVIEDFVTRQGAVHGHADTPLEAQIEAVLRQLRSGKVALVFDPESESCVIVEQKHLHQRRPEQGPPPRRE